MGFRVGASGYGFQNSGFRVEDIGFSVWVWGSGFRIQGLGFEVSVQASGSRLRALGFRLQASGLRFWVSV